MLKSLAPAIALVAMVAIPTTTALASGSETPPAEIAEQIRAKLTEQGYEVRKIETEDGLYEAYVLKDGQRHELYLNAELDIVKQKTDD